MMSADRIVLLAVVLLVQIGLELWRNGGGSGGGAAVAGTAPPTQCPVLDSNPQSSGGGGRGQSLSTSSPPITSLAQLRDTDPQPSLYFSRPLFSFNQFPEFELPFDLSKCNLIYLDLGTNEGWQLEKLFFGVKPTSKWAKKFAVHFHPNAKERQKMVCAIGAEPDRNHKASLDRLEKNLTDLGVRVKILRNPIWVNNDVLTFHSIYDPDNHHDASTLSTEGHSVFVKANNTRTSNVNTTKVSLRGFRLSTLLAQIPNGAKVLAKMDIEGAEHRVLADIVLDGTICRINFFGIETHAYLMKDDAHIFSTNILALNRFLERSQRCRTWARLFDDEE